jgi:hypothetical protein
LLVYIEYISRLPGVSLEAFHFAAGRQHVWSAEYEADRLVLSIGRTFRTGPLPEYLTVWYTPDAGLERLSEWERVFQSGAADDLEQPFKLVARIDKAGCYEALLEPVSARGGLYYGEYFDFAGDASRDHVSGFFRARCERHPGIELNLLCDGIGKLAPDPRGLAIWNVHSWDRLDGLARELDKVVTPVRLVTAGIYRDLGQETL